MTKNKYTQLVMGLTNYLPSHTKYRVLFGEIDREYNDRKVKAMYHTILSMIGTDHNLIVYKSRKGYHYISLNFYTLKQWRHLLFMLGDNGILCHNFIAFSLWFNKSTLRVTRKYDMEQVELLHSNIGKLPKSIPHCELFSLLSTNRKDSDFIACDDNDRNYGIYWRWYRVKPTKYNIADYLPRLVTDGVKAEVTT